MQVSYKIVILILQEAHIAQQVEHFQGKEEVGYSIQPVGKTFIFFFN